MVVLEVVVMVVVICGSDEDGGDGCARNALCSVCCLCLSGLN